MTSGENTFDAVRGAFGSMKSGVDGTVTDYASPDEVGTALDGLRASTSSNAALLADLMTDRATGVIGKRLVLTPDGTGTGFGPGWTAGGVAAVERSNGVWRWIRAGSAQRYAWGIVTGHGPTDSDFQLIRMAQTTSVETPVHRGYNEGAGNALIARANADGTEFVAAVMGRTAMSLWRYASATWTMLNSWPGIIPSPGAVGTKELIAGTPTDDRQFVINYSGISRSWTDTADVTSLGEDFRYGGIGFVSDYRASSPSSETIPGRISLVGVSDNAPTGIIGTGFRVSRTDSSTETLTLTAGESDLPDNWFDTVDYLSADLLWDATTGVVTVLREGLYAFQWGAVLNSAASGVYATMLLARSGFADAAAHTVDLHSGRLGGTAVAYSASFLTYCGPGEYLQPQLSGSGDVILRGESSGVRAFFSGALLNPS